MSKAINSLTGLALIAGAVWIFVEQSGGWWVALGVVLLLVGLMKSGS